MRIVPKYQGGNNVKISGVKYANGTGEGWINSVFRGGLSDYILNNINSDSDDFIYWVNQMQDDHYDLMKNAGNNWQDNAYKSDAVARYQDNFSGRNYTGQFKPSSGIDLNTLGISNAFKNGRYLINGKRTSGDNPNNNWKTDGLLSGITADRMALGKADLWSDEAILQFNEELAAKNVEMYKDENTGYMKLRRIPTPINGGVYAGPKKEESSVNAETGGEIVADLKVDTPKTDIWGKLRKAAPGILDAARLAGNLYNNLRVYNETLKGIRPNLLQSYNTYRQVVGDEATKLAYYRRAALGQTQAGRAITSDLDKLLAYLMEAKRVGDELRSQGDLADNQEIRRTSDESNQHQWANTLRATEVANRNLIELNNANAARHNLAAQKYSADWTNVDNYLMGIQGKMELKKAEDNQLRDLIWSMTVKLGLYEDPGYNAAYAEYEKILKAKNNNYSDPEVVKAARKVTKALNQYLINLYRNKSNFNIETAKSGTKLTYDNKYVYKTAKEVVEHFRKMSKMSDDSRLKSRTNPIKLSPHPRKMLQGGVAPFTIYRPLASGATLLTTTDSGSVKTSKDDSGKNKLDLLLNLFTKLKGLPVDVSSVYSDILNLLNKSKAFGEELSTDDIASIYLTAMLKASQLAYDQKNHEDAKQLVIANEGINEIAVGHDGRMVLQDAETGKIKIGTLSEYLKSEGKLNPLTNDLVLNLRAYSLPFKNDLMEIVNNGVGMNKIAEQILKLAGSLGANEEKIEGLSEVLSRKVKAGLLILGNLDGTPDGLYKVSQLVKDPSSLISAALSYIEGMLPKNYKTLLELHSNGNGKLLILSMLTSRASFERSLDLDAITGKANNKELGNGDEKMLPSVAFFNGLGEKDSFIIQDKTNDGLKIDVVSTPITSKGYNTGSITFDKLESSDFGGQLLMNLATMGDSLISSMGRNNIIIDDRIYLTELPIDQEAKRTTGIIKPDLKFLKKIEIADAKLRQMGIDKSDPKNVAIINKVYLENNLPILYTISDNKPTITSEYARFAIVNGIGTEEAFGDNPEFNDGILEISSDKERQQFETMMQLLGNTKYKLNNGYGIGPLSWGETKLYKGTIYIPMVTSNISALAGTGFKAKGEEYNLIEAKQQAADAARNKGFVPAGDASNIK